MLQPKDTDWLNIYQNKTHIYAVYKKPTSDLTLAHWPSPLLLNWREGIKLVLDSQSGKEEIAVFLKSSFQVHGYLCSGWEEKLY